MARRGRQRDGAKEAFWRKVVDGFDAGRSTVGAWCVKHGVSEPSFYAWRRELQRRDRVPAKNTVSGTATRLLRVEVSPPQRSGGAVMIELATGVRVHVAIDQLSEVLDVLEAR